MNEISLTESLQQTLFRILSQRGAKRICEVVAVLADSALIDDAFVVFKYELDGILDRNDMAGSLPIYAIYHTCDCGRFSTSRRSRK